MKTSVARVWVLAMITAASVAAASNVVYGQGYKPSPPPGQNHRSVPEPSTMLLIGAGAAVAFGVRKLWR
jgi:PEP-CTERM motif-containing protein